MMVRVDYRDEENRATVRCHLCGSVSALMLDAGRFRCRGACPPLLVDLRDVASSFAKWADRLGEATR